MVGGGDIGSRSADKTDRRASRELIAAYHRSELRALLEHVRGGFEQLDSGEIDEFDLDTLIHHYKRSAAELEVLRIGRGSVAAGGERLDVPARAGRRAGLVGAGRSSAAPNSLISSPSHQRPAARQVELTCEEGCGHGAVNAVAPAVAVRQ